MTCLAPTCTPYLTLISTVNNNADNNYNLDSDSENIIKGLSLASIYCLSFNNCLFIAEFSYSSTSNILHILSQYQSISIRIIAQ